MAIGTVQAHNIYANWDALAASQTFAFVQTLSGEINQYLKRYVLGSFRWEAVNQLILSRHIADSADDELSRYTETLPLLTCQAVSQRYQPALPLAAAWQLLLLAAQLLDDLQDNDNTTNYEPYLSKPKYLPAAIYILGISRVALAQSDISGATAKTLFALIGEMQAHGAHAQALDLSKSLSLEHYFETIIGKTANLYAVISEAGARIGNNDPEIWKICNHYGMALGISKQILDDCSDLYKPNATCDLSQAHDTLPVIRGMQLDAHPLHSKLQTLISSSDKRSFASCSQIKQILDEMEAISWCINLAQLHRAQAIACINQLPEHNANAGHLINYANA